MAKANPIENGTRVTIRSRDSWANGQWGIVKGFDGEHYHVAIYDGAEQLVFTRRELAASPRPTATQRKAMERMAAADGRVQRIPGGFWVSGSFTVNAAGAPNCESVDITSIRAMERSGWIERAHEYPETWRDTRRLTAAGRAVLEVQ